MAIPKIEDLRRRIDQIDEEIIKLITKRLELCREIGELKKAYNIPVVDRRREQQVLERAGPYRRVFEILILLCKEIQRRLK